MTLADVNVLLHAFREDAEWHADCKLWLTSLVNGDQPYAVSPQVLSSVIRISTNPKVWKRPDKLSSAIAFAEAILDQPHCRIVQPGSGHWKIFRNLCDDSGATGNLVQDAWFAAIAIEHGCEWITENRDYARFRGLRWRSVRRV